jgi:GT2 family glycosyltransferase
VELVETGWLQNLIAVMESDSQIGAVGAVSNNVFGNQRRDKAGRGITLTNFLIGFCLLLRKDAVLQVGLLDERFDPDGNYSDFDYSQRLTRKGWKLAIAENVWVNHAAHTTQKDLDFNANLQRNQAKYQAKWGIA